MLGLHQFVQNFFHPTLLLQRHLHLVHDELLEGPIVKPQELSRLRHVDDVADELLVLAYPFQLEHVLLAEGHQLPVVIEGLDKLGAQNYEVLHPRLVLGQ